MSWQVFRLVHPSHQPKANSGLQINPPVTRGGLTASGKAQS